MDVALIRLNQKLISFQSTGREWNCDRCVGDCRIRRSDRDKITPTKLNDLSSELK